MKASSFVFVSLLFIMFSCRNTKPKVINTIKDSHLLVLPSIENCGFQSSSTASKEWNLIFEENFDASYKEKWDAWRGGAFNEELQHYQAENVIVENGLLFLHGKRESVQGRRLPKDEEQRSFEFTSGRIESKQLFGPKNIEGKKTIKFSARLKLPEGEGLWPAWWSYGHPWPTQGEIDILEARGHTPHEFSSCLHYGERASYVDTEAEENVFEYKHSEKLTDCFHIYEMEWSKGNIKIFLDEKLLKDYDAATYPFVKSFWGKENMLTLNLAIGGIFFKSYDVSKIPDDSFYVIDWVKVYEK